MAPPLTHDQWLTILRAEGVTVAEYPGWRTRQRDDETGKPFGPVHMFLNHHTAGRNDRDVVARDGVPGLPAPLAHVYLAKSGVATMCSAGRANHAGLMAVNAYNSFRDEESTHPAPSKASGTTDGNDVAYGIETENLGDGKDVYPRAQYDAWVRINAAVCRHHGWGAESVGCHKETSIEGKVDPRGPVEGYGGRGRFEFTPKQFRADVAERLTHPASWSPGSAPEEDDPMAGITKADIYDAVWATDKVTAPADAPDAATNKTWQPQSYLRDTNTRVRGLEKQLAALAATNAKLVDAVAKLAAAQADLDPAAIVAELKQAIESVTIRLDTDSA
ncbi:N-acetylmuramoyl-L-alanine amidase [Streptomyces flaveolus]|uniref:N-acetylmuramoyl-L-alanine amidase n=1 Tax=Streptomyces flaveolus TaxID=67297 RepID=UPI0033DBC00E